MLIKCRKYFAKVIILIIRNKNLSFYIDIKRQMAKHCKCCCHTYPENGHVINAENSELLADVGRSNLEYSGNYKPDAGVVLKRPAILTCMDYRINLEQLLGPIANDAYVLRNAGGLATEDVNRSIVILSKLLNIGELFVIQHSDCGMQKFNQRTLDYLLKESLVSATLVKDCNVDWRVVEPNCSCKFINTVKCGSWKNKEIAWQPILCGLEQSVYETVKTIRNYPGLPSYIPIYGFIFDVSTGKLIPVEKAFEVGRATPLCCDK